MILGVGTDIIAIARIEKLVQCFGDRFLHRCFTDREIQHAQSSVYQNHEKKMAFFAKRFAAKEACVKAMGHGFGNGIYYKDISVSTDAYGKPSLQLHESVISWLHKKHSLDKEILSHLSLSDDFPYATAVVVLEVL